MDRSHETLKVFLAEDEYVIRQGIRNSIDWSARGYDFCGDVGDGEMAYAMIREKEPDIVITDIRMPFMDGLALSRLIKKEFPSIEIILLTGYEEFEYAKEAIDIGVARYLSKPVSGEQLMKEVDALAAKILEKREEQALVEQYAREMGDKTEQKKQDFFRSLVTGRKSMPEILDDAGKLGIELIAPWYRIVLIRIWSTRHDADEYSGAVLDTEEQLEKAAEEDGGLVFDRDLEGKALLLRAESKEVLEHKTERCREVLSELALRHTSMRYFGGVGTAVTRTGNIPASFEAARSALAHRYMDKENQFFAGTEAVPGGQKDAPGLRDLRPDSALRSQLMEFLRLGDSSETDIFLEEYLRSMDGDALQSALLRQYIVMDVYFCAAEFIEKELKGDRDTLEMPGPGSDAFLGREQAAAYIRRIVTKAVEEREKTVRSRSHEAVEQAISYIRTHYAEEDLSLNTLASHVNFSPNHLSSVFRQETGQTFIHYLTEYRMKEARELLRLTSKKSSEISLMVGYRDPHYFSYLFKKTQGVTPTQYREG